MPRSASAEFAAASPHAGDLARFRRLLGHVHPYRWRLLGAALALASVSLLEPLITIAFSQIIDRGFAAGAESVSRASMAAPTGAIAQSFLAPIVGLLAQVPVVAFPLLLVLIFALRGLANFIGDAGLHWVASRVICDIRCMIFAHLLRLPVAFFDRHPPAELSSRITFDAQQVGQATSQALTALVQDTLKLLLALVLMAAVSWKLTLGVLLVAPLVAVVVRQITRRLRRASEKMQTDMGELARFTDESLRHQRTVKVFAAFDWIGERFARRAHAVRQTLMKQETANAMATPLIHLAVSLAIAGIVALAIAEGQRGRMTAGDFFLFFTALIAILPPLKSLASVNAVIQRGLAAAATLFRLADEPAEAQGRSSQGGSTQGSVPALSFEQVVFRYPGREEAALDGVSFQVPAGQRVAFVGPSGSGKSSVIALAAGFYLPQAGTVRIAGEAMTAANATALRERVSLVSQDVLLINDTVSANIAFGAARIDTERVRWAAEVAAAHDFIEALPQGYDTRVGEGGSLLSGGQRQRIAIARALYRDAPIVLFDEATSALDAATEAQVIAALVRLTPGKTVLHVAHRLSTVRDADCIFVMQASHIVEQGRHEELLTREGPYRQLSALQSA